MVLIGVAVVLATHFYREMQKAHEIGATSALSAALAVEFDTNADFATRFRGNGQRHQLVGDEYADWIDEMRVTGRLDPSGEAEHDRWGNQYHIYFFPNKEQTTVTVSSDGPDGIHGNQDDIVKSWSQEGSLLKPTDKLRGVFIPLR